MAGPNAEELRTSHANDVDGWDRARDLGKSVGDAVLSVRSRSLRFEPLREDLSRVNRLAESVAQASEHLQTPHTPRIRAAIDEARRAIRRLLAEAGRRDRESRQRAEALDHELRDRLAEERSKVERLEAAAAESSDACFETMARGRIENLRNEIDRYRTMQQDLDRARSRGT